jgi:hypothetical protein
MSVTRLAAALLVASFAFAPTAHADPDDDPGTGQEICDAFHLETSPATSTATTAGGTTWRGQR